MTTRNPWHQTLIEFPDQDHAEATAAARLAPLLNTAQQEGLLDSWWYIRKAPGWRLRYQTDESGSHAVEDLLTQLAETHHLTHTPWGVYEPESVAFGGPAGMDLAHALFHHDSRQTLHHAAQQNTSPSLGRREMTVLLYSAMLRAAGLDWFEQGDAWAKVADLRPAETAHARAPERWEQLRQSMRRLMTIDATGAPELIPGPWSAAFAIAGQQLAGLARTGQLQRGLRAVLAHHFIFHANRAGLTGPDQATLAALAVDTVFRSPDRPHPTGATSKTLKVRDMTSTLGTPTAESASPDALRNQLADTLMKDNAIRTAAVEAAIRHVPRHLFVPAVPLEEAYANDAVYTKHDGTGASISAASQPAIVAMMLEQLQIRPGDRVLELGAGTGYNAALMAHLTGSVGAVTAIDVDDDLVEDARKHLKVAGVANADIVLTDGALGHPASAPYDRVIATVGAYEVPTPWLEQLAPTGRLVVPLRLRGAASRSIIFERAGDGWVSRGSEMAVFMPLRGIGDDARRIVDLTGNSDVTLQTHKDNQHATDPATLGGVLDTPAREVWTGVHFVPMESFEWLDLWLACRLDNPLMRMNVEPAAKESGLVKPMFPAVAMSTTTADGSLAYLTIRAAEPAPGGGRRFEVGVVAHGLAGQQLAEHLASEISVWDNGFRTRTVHFALPDSTPTATPETGRFILDRARHPISVTWE